MQPSSVFINASEVLCSKLNGHLTEEALTESYLLETRKNSIEAPLESNHFVYKSINNLPLIQENRIFQTLTELFDQLIQKQNLTKEQLSKTVLFLGSSSMDIGEIKSDRHRSIWLNSLDRVAKTLSEKYQLSDLNFTFNTACTSSANAIIYASRMLKINKIEKAIVVGFEFFNELTIKGFSSLELLSKKTHLAFSKGRDGMILGEGVGLLLLSTESNHPSDLEIKAGHSACDTFNLTTPNENGFHMASVIEETIRMSGLDSQDIDLIKVHGTASPASDNAEHRAIASVFSEPPPIIALKPFTGHTLGACAAIETALTCDVIKNNSLPLPEYTKRVTDCLLPFLNEANHINNYQFHLHNYLGFGGNNAAILLRNATYKPLS